MKTGFNGIWQVNQSSNGRFATPSGLLNQTTKVYDKDNVIEWNTFLQKVDICCGDWSACTALAEGKTFFFFDPPYRDSFTSYGQVFNDTHQLALIDFCKQEDLKGHIMMFCNRDAGDTFYTDNQGQLEISYYNVTYTAGRRKQNKNDEGLITSQTAKVAKEILLYSSSIKQLSSPVTQISKKIKDVSKKTEQSTTTFNEMFQTQA
jgi:DNA adenine methylase